MIVADLLREQWSLVGQDIIHSPICSALWVVAGLRHKHQAEIVVQRWGLPSLEGLPPPVGQDGLLFKVPLVIDNTMGQHMMAVEYNLGDPRPLYEWLWKRAKKRKKKRRVLGV